MSVKNREKKIKNRIKNKINKKIEKNKFTFEYFTPIVVCSLSKFYLFAAAFIHVLIATLFFYTGVTTLGVINVISCVAYTIFAIIITDSTIRKIYCFVIAEIMFFIVINVFTFGWNYNFYLYSFSLISLGILTSISPKENKYNIKYPLIIFLISHIGLLCLKLYHVDNPVIPNYEFSEEIEKVYNIQGIISYVFVSCALFMPLLAFVVDLNMAAKKIETINNELDYISTHDTLTELINRRSMEEIFKDILAEVKETNKTFAIILSDIDDFKKINDTYGHNAGDYVLQNVSKVITKGVKEDGYVCRWGGEEIMILYEGDCKAAVNRAEKIRKNIEEEVFEYEGSKIDITMTFGVAEYISNMDINEIIVKADDNMYKGKKGTKNCVIA